MMHHANYQKLLAGVKYPAELPISAKKNDIVEAIRRNQVVVIAGDTGSGKTTQVPKMCIEAGLGMRGRIGCTQPRRIAALTISRRVAEELGVNWGEDVGCKIRFGDKTGGQTRIKFMTDGILLAETQGDPQFREYEAIILDEAHERSLNIDFLLGYLKRLLDARRDLKLLITSATIDTQAFSKAFNDAPVIEVSGRMYPVETVYMPLDEAAVENGDISYVDAAVKAVDLAISDSRSGDVLVFMPSERDIREAVDQMQGAYGHRAEVMPLFGRLTAEEQQRVFALSGRRKIVVSTNIAETSLTIPGIRYVVDTGLARMSRYSANTRTKRLPIEPIAQSSANQRKGRCGRVQNGVCIRLYSEEDFNSRPLYAQPEIQRANLAEVILRMKAMHLGEIEDFPFIDPPRPQAIRAGCQLLQELGALDETKQITRLGRDLSRLPVDPSIGRMILQAIKEGALSEVVIIAAGLSIQDPRERPLEQESAADAAHKQFLDPHSDFLTLLAIWDAYHDRLDTLKTQSQIRKFCKSHFLSFNRMREWRDIYTQLGEMVEELPGVRWNTKGASYDAIHRCILTGLWGHIAMRTGKNQYQIQGNKAVTLFPGSSLFDRNAPKKHDKKEPAKAPEPKTAQPPWLVSGEIVETSKVFIRTVAMIDVPWILELGAHLCRYSHTDAHWDAEAGRVVIRETVTLHGMVVQDQYIGCDRVDPKQATEIFIQSALVNGEMESPHKFLEHNRQVIHKLELWQTRVRHRDAIGLFDKIFEFYAKQLENVSSVHDLNKVMRERLKTNPQFLCMKLEDLTGGPDSGFDAGLFPDAVKVGSGTVEVDYAYAPGKDNDGATLRVPLELAADIRPGMLDGAVPALREETIDFLLQNLPKHVRRVFVPVQEHAARIAAAVLFEPGKFLENLSLHIRNKYGVVVPASDWAVAQLPEHLRPRIEVRGKDSKLIAASRDAAAIQESIRKEQGRVDTSVLRQMIEKWERYHLSGWTFFDMPEQVEAKTPSGLVFRLYPGLHHEEGNVSIRLFKTLDEAHLASTIGFPKLCEKHFNKELAWLQRDLRQLDKSSILYVTLGSPEELRETAWDNISRYLFECDPLLPLAKARFDAVAQSASLRMKDLLPRFCSWIDMILQQRQGLLVCRKPYATLRQDLDVLLPKAFLRAIPFGQLQHIPRYLKAMQMRAERAALNPAKDAERARQVAPYLEALKTIASKPAKNSREMKWRVEFRWLVEEFKVSCFAQELGTACPVSARRLDDFLKQPPV